MVTYEQIKNNAEINCYIQKANEHLKVLGYTDHSKIHCLRVVAVAEKILTALRYDERKVELAKIAAYMHDIGNMVNRNDHAYSGGVIAFQILSRLSMDFDEIGSIVGAIGNHDELGGDAVNSICAAVILGDKTDVRRSRVRNRTISSFDIHDRVNYAVTRSDVMTDAKNKTITLDLTIDTEISSVTSYFEIFLGRMMMCTKAAEYLGCQFALVINGAKLL